MAKPDSPQRRTRVAHSGLSKHRFFAYDVFEELAGTASFWEIVSIALGGPLLTRDDCRVLDDLLACCTVADPRLPPLKLVRLAATYGGVMAGFGTGYLALEDAFIGPWSSGATAQLLVDCAAAVDAGSDADATVHAFVAAAIERQGYLPGFGVPFRERDERVAALDHCLRHRNRHQGRYWRLMRKVEAAVLAERGVGSNIGAGMAACLLDLGFTPAQIPTLGTLSVLACILANAFEAADQQAPELQSLAPNQVAYVGRPARESPRAVEASLPGPREETS